NKRMLGFQGPAQPSPTLGDAINAGFGYLEVKCLGCNTHQTVALDIVRRPKTTPVHELERYMRCKDCSVVRGYSIYDEALSSPRKELAAVLIWTAIEILFDASSEQHKTRAICEGMSSWIGHGDNRDHILQFNSKLISGT